jgi:hypothetical protein
MVGYILGMYIAETKEAVVLCSDSSFFMISKHLRPCLVAKNFAKFFNIPRHIESLDACMKH